MASLVVITFAHVLVASCSGAVFFKDRTARAQTLEIRENNTLLRTQFLPIKTSKISKPQCHVPENDEIKQRNSTYEIRDGKLYRITRVKKKINLRPCEETQAERRTGLWEATKLKTIVPLSSSSQLDENNSTLDKTWQFWTSSHPITSKTLARKKEKIKKLLNLFTIVKFDNEGCFIDGLKGTCYHQSECGERGGRAIGPCARGFGVCCYIERSCGQFTNENCTYFINEGFPQVSTGGPSICALTVQKAHPDVRQLRLEFETFELRGPVNGTCLLDRLLVSGQNRNSVVPDLCGVNTGQHIYVDVDATNGPYQLNVVTMGAEPSRKWRIKVTQLRPGNELIAPQNCLQYFTELTGVVESFNYQHQISGNAGQASPGYFNNLNYDACIKKSEAFCTITYDNQPINEPEWQFEMINYNTEGEPVIPRGQAGAEVFNCPDDYVITNGIRLCGDKLNDATTELDYTRSSSVTDLSAGPAHLKVRTNEENVAKGFRLVYKQNPCLE